MTAVKRKAVINAEQDQLDRIAELVAAGRYRTLSAFVREAIDEKLGRIRRARLADQVRRYCDSGAAVDDAELVGWQAFPQTEVRPRSARTRTRRSTARAQR